ncbi:MAG TPA: serine hydrolase [Gemmatimonadaceae bacterium]
MPSDGDSRSWTSAPIRTLSALGALLFCFAILPRCRTSAKQVDESTELPGIERILEEQRRVQHLPGLAFAIVEDDRVIYSRALGLRDVEHNLPVTPDTLFPIGSCTKAFTSMAIALGQDRGLLTLDDHPRKFLPYFRMADPEADANVTLRDMLSHRTGLKAKADLAAEPGVLNREEYVQAATSAKPTAKFRAAFQYSNAMFSAAGEIVAKANRSTWERVIEAEIFDPLGMHSSVTSTERALTVKNHATGYVYESSALTFRAVPPPRSLEAMAPAGNIASTARDMTQWLRVLTGSGRIDGRRFLSESMFHELTTPVIPINSSISYALGWATYEWNGLRVVEHNGGSEGISALVSFIPERRIGFVFLANTSPNFMTQIGNAGKLFYPLILYADGQARQPTNDVERRPSPAGTSSGETATSATTSDAPTVDALLQRMLDAAGGEAGFRRHTSTEIHARKTYDNQGVIADLTVQEMAPAMRNEVEAWTAAGKQIGRVRVYFNGVGGGQETTFGQDATNDAAANIQARREDAFHELLDLKSLYKNVTVRGSSKVGAEDTWVVELTPAQGSSSRLHVSQSTGLILQRESEGQTLTFADYRDVDGERVPFLTTINDPLGETTIAVDSVRFNVAIPEAAFRVNKETPVR